MNSEPMSHEEVNARIAELEATLRSIANNAPVTEPPSQFTSDFTPLWARATVWSFWVAGELARAVLLASKEQE